MFWYAPRSNGWGILSIYLSTDFHLACNVWAIHCSEFTFSVSVFWVKHSEMTSMFTSHHHMNLTLWPQMTLLDTWYFLRTLLLSTLWPLPCDPMMTTAGMWCFINTSCWHIIFWQNQKIYLYVAGQLASSDDIPEFVDWLTQAVEVATKDLFDDSFEHLTQASTGATTGDWFVVL